MTRCKLTPDSGGIAVKTPYDAGFVNELKSAIPYTDRRYKPESKMWIVTPGYGSTLQNLCMKYFNELPLLPDAALKYKPTITQRILDVRYIGQTKDRGSDERSAYGWYADGWNVIFPETVLRGWFDAPSMPDEQPNLYSVLLVKRNATEDEIKSAYRRLAKQWHPDVSKEPGSAEQFMTIQRAYDVLTKNRERYDAGLALEASLKNGKGSTLPDHHFSGYRSPLRCGLIMAEGIEQMGIFNVSKIFAWEDIKDSHGRVLVVSWKAGDDHFSEVWA